jgi:hypothetical protein
MTNHKSFEEFESDPVIIFEEFLHMFFDGGGSEMPFDKEYYSSYLGSKKFKVVDEEGNICENPVVFEALKPHLQKYGYQLTPDNFLVKKENTKMNKITLNTETGRYELEGRDLSSGTTLTVLFDGIAYSARVEYSDKYSNGYYAILFPNDGEPFMKSLDECWMGTFKTYSLDSDEVQEALKDID